MLRKWSHLINNQSLLYRARSPNSHLIIKLWVFLDASTITFLFKRQRRNQITPILLCRDYFTKIKSRYTFIIVPRQRGESLFGIRIKFLYISM